MGKLFTNLAYSASERRQRTTILRPLIQDNPGEPVLLQRRNLLEQPLDFYEPDVLPAA